MLSPNPLIFEAMYRIMSVILVLWIAGCKPPLYSPKPLGYYKVDTPAEHKYQVFDRPGFPYTFEYPVYAVVADDTVFAGEVPDNPYWLNINFPALGGSLNLTYKPITAKQPLIMLVQKAHEMSAFHDKISQGVETSESDNGAHVYVFTYNIAGDAATKYQFTATDSVKHFIRGALYFDVTPNADSLQPSYDFIEQDIRHMLWTMRWRG